jgi:hypothetical protein
MGARLTSLPVSLSLKRPPPPPPPPSAAVHAAQHARYTLLSLAPLSFNPSIWGLGRKLLPRPASLVWMMFTPVGISPKELPPLGQ